MSALELIDIGINLGHDSYDGDRDAVLARALAVGVRQMVVTGASLDGTPKAIHVARSHPRPPAGNRRLPPASRGGNSSPRSRRGPAVRNGRRTGGRRAG